MKLIIAGGSGFLGQVLALHFQSQFKDIVILSRTASVSKTNIRTVAWDGRSCGRWLNELNGCDVLINLTGKNVNCRYTKKNKAEILNSRLDSTRILGEAIRTAQNPPKMWIQAGSSTIYNHAHHPNDEHSNNMGDDFSMTVCKEWERTFWEVNAPLTKKILMRVAIVLGEAGGAWPTLKWLAKVGLGGKQGNGNQMISWIHEHDFARVVDWLSTNGKANGVYNVCSPAVATNQQFMRIVRKAIGVPMGIPSPDWLLNIGAALIRTETELVLKSRYVSPKNLLTEGFQFQYAGLEKAISNLTA
jgi:uncharacterized protein